MMRHRFDDDSTGGELAPRMTVDGLYTAKLDIIARMHELEEKDHQLRKKFETIKGYTPYDLSCHDSGLNRETEKGYEKCVDRWCWKYLVDLFGLHRYMLCTAYKQLQDDIEAGRTPDFTPDNARGWLASLQDLVNDNVRTLIHQVFDELTRGTYRTGSSWNSPEKKRNNNGVDARFILHTGDWSSLFGYYSDKPTVTDDLEKVCYIVAGQELPKITAKETMRKDKVDTYKNEFFELKVCQNGNTHYVLSDTVRDALNLYGPSGAILGENVKIKIVERVQW